MLKATPGTVLGSGDKAVSCLPKDHSGHFHPWVLRPCSHKNCKEKKAARKCSLLVEEWKGWYSHFQSLEAPSKTKYVLIVQSSNWTLVYWPKGVEDIYTQTCKWMFLAVLLMTFDCEWMPKAPVFCTETFSSRAKTKGYKVMRRERTLHEAQQKGLYEPSCDTLEKTKPWKQSKRSRVTGVGRTSKSSIKEFSAPLIWHQNGESVWLICPNPWDLQDQERTL